MSRTIPGLPARPGGDWVPAPGAGRLPRLDRRRATTSAGWASPRSAWASTTTTRRSQRDQHRHGHPLQRVRLGRRRVPDAGSTADAPLAAPGATQSGVSRDPPADPRASRGARGPERRRPERRDEPVARSQHRQVGVSLRVGAAVRRRHPAHPVQARRREPGLLDAAAHRQGQGQWPPALQGDQFAAERRAYSAPSTPSSSSRSRAR